MTEEAAKCPICGHEDWTPSQWPILLREADPKTVHGGGVRAEAYVCASCSFIRLHRLAESP